MFEHLAKHKKIIVTGPNRSGTTLAATAIQHDLKTTHGLIKEELCQFRIEGVQVWMDCPEPMVIQAPFIADACHQFPTALVVYMHRDLKDIEKSIQSMTMESGERVNWPRMERIENSKFHNSYGMSSAEAKYESWEVQKEKLINYMDLQYTDLSWHPLWVDNRPWFHVRQTSAVG